MGGRSASNAAWVWDSSGFAIGARQWGGRRLHALPPGVSGYDDDRLRDGQVERFFRVAAGLEVDKSDLKRYSDFVDQKLYDLLIRGEAAAKANARPAIAPFDLPITKALQESIHAFKRLDKPVDLKRIPEGLIARPLLDLPLSEETEATLPEIAGGLSVALARTLTIINSAQRF